MGATSDFQNSYLSTALFSDATSATAYGHNGTANVDTLRLVIHCASAL